MDIEASAHSADGHEVKGTLYPASEPKGTALLVHGITADRSEWGFYQLIGPRLAASGITSFAIDLRGHGRSAFPPERLSLAGAMLDLQAASEFLRSQVGDDLLPGFIVGNSFGGGISYLFGMSATTISGIFLTAPVLSYIQDIGMAATGTWSRPEQPTTFQYVKFHLSQLLIPEMYFFDREIAEVLPTKPFTIVHGGADADVPIALSKAFVASRQLGRLVELEGMDHCWATPGDLPPFLDPRSVANRGFASEKLSELMIAALQ